MSVTLVLGGIPTPDQNTWEYQPFTYGTPATGYERYKHGNLGPGGTATITMTVSGETGTLTINGTVIALPTLEPDQQINLSLSNETPAYFAVTLSNFSYSQQ